MASVGILLPVVACLSTAVGTYKKDACHFTTQFFSYLEARGAVQRSDRVFQILEDIKNHPGRLLVTLAGGGCPSESRMRQVLRALHFDGVTNWLPKRAIPEGAASIFKVGFIEHDRPAACLAQDYFSGLMPLLTAGVKTLVMGGDLMAPRRVPFKPPALEPDVGDRPWRGEGAFRQAILTAKEIPGHTNRADYLIKVADSLARAKLHPLVKERLFDEMINSTYRMVARTRAIAGIGAALFHAGFREKARGIIGSLWARARTQLGFYGPVRHLPEIVSQLARGRLFGWAEAMLEDCFEGFRKAHYLTTIVAQSFNKMLAIRDRLARDRRAPDFLRKLEAGIQSAFRSWTLEGAIGDTSTSQFPLPMREINRILSENAVRELSPSERSL